MALLLGGLTIVSVSSVGYYYYYHGEDTSMSDEKIDKLKAELPTGDIVKELSEFKIGSLKPSNDRKLREKNDGNNLDEAMKNVREKLGIIEDDK